MLLVGSEATWRMDQNSAVVAASQSPVPSGIHFYCNNAYFSKQNSFDSTAFTSNYITVEVECGAFRALSHYSQVTSNMYYDHLFPKMFG